MRLKKGKKTYHLPAKIVQVQRVTLKITGGTRVTMRALTYNSFTSLRPRANATYPEFYTVKGDQLLITPAPKKNWLCEIVATKRVIL